MQSKMVSQRVQKSTRRLSLKQIILRLLAMRLMAMVLTRMIANTPSNWTVAVPTSISWGEEQSIWENLTTLTNQRNRWKVQRLSTWMSIRLLTQTLNHPEATFKCLISETIQITMLGMILFWSQWWSTTVTCCLTLCFHKSMRKSMMTRRSITSTSTSRSSMTSTWETTLRRTRANRMRTTTDSSQRTLLRFAVSKRTPKWGATPNKVMTREMQVWFKYPLETIATSLSCLITKLSTFPILTKFRTSKSMSSGFQLATTSGGYTSRNSRESRVPSLRCTATRLLRILTKTTSLDRP